MLAASLFPSWTSPTLTMLQLNIPTAKTPAKFTKKMKKQRGYLSNLTSQHHTIESGDAEKQGGSKKEKKDGEKYAMEASHTE